MFFVSVFVRFINIFRIVQYRLRSSLVANSLINVGYESDSENWLETYREMSHGRPCFHNIDFMSYDT